MRNDEERLHIAVCDYVRLQYPNEIFHSDGSGLNLSKRQQGVYPKMKSDRGMPDWYLLTPRNGYHGLIIEFKAFSPWKVNGYGLKKNKHVEEQYEMIKRLRTKGYAAYFGVGFDDCKRIIDIYMGCFYAGHPTKQILK